MGDGEDEKAVIGEGAAEEEREEIADGESGAAADAKKKKNKKKKKKGSGEGGDDDGDAGADESAGVLGGMDSKLLSQHIARLTVAGQVGSTTISPAAFGKQHAFWDSQPMRRPDERPDTGGPIEPVDKEVRAEGYNLPAGFEWFTCDVDDDKQVGAQPSPRQACPPESCQGRTRVGRGSRGRLCTARSVCTY